MQWSHCTLDAATNTTRQRKRINKFSKKKDYTNHYRNYFSTDCLQGQGAFCWLPRVQLGEASTNGAGQVTRASAIGFDQGELNTNGNNGSGESPQLPYPVTIQNGIVWPNSNKLGLDQSGAGLNMATEVIGPSNRVDGYWKYSTMKDTGFVMTVLNECPLPEEIRELVSTKDGGQ